MYKKIGCSLGANYGHNLAMVQKVDYFIGHSAKF